MNIIDELRNYIDENWGKPNWSINDFLNTKIDEIKKLSVLEIWDIYKSLGLSMDAIRDKLIDVIYDKLFFEATVALNIKNSQKGGEKNDRKNRG